MSNANPRSQEREAIASPGVMCKQCTSGLLSPPLGGELLSRLAGGGELQAASSGEPLGGGAHAAASVARAAAETCRVKVISSPQQIQRAPINGPSHMHPPNIRPDLLARPRRRFSRGRQVAATPRPSSLKITGQQEEPRRTAWQSAESEAVSRRGPTPRGRARSSRPEEQTGCWLGCLGSLLL